MAKDPKTIQEQIELLKDREMGFREIANASHFLANISYYRLKGYWWEIKSIQMAWLNTISSTKLFS